MKLFLPCLLSWIFLSPLIAEDDPLADKLAALQAAMLDEATARKNPQTRDDYPPSSAFEKYTAPMFIDLSRLSMHEYDVAPANDPEGLIKQILSDYTSVGVQTTGKDILDLFQAHRTAWNAHFSQEVQANVDRLKKTIATETDPSKFDEIILLFHPAPKELFWPPEAITPANRPIGQLNLWALNFAVAWQDYLYQKAHGQVEGARRTLQKIEEHRDGPYAAFKSEIADQVAAAEKNLPPPEEVSAVIDGVRELDQIEAAVERIHIINWIQDHEEDEGNARILRRYNRIYKFINAEMPAPITPLFPDNNSSFPNQGLSEKMLDFVTAHYLSSYKGPLGKKGETVDTMVERIVADAISRQDWQLLRKALEMQDILIKSGPKPDYPLNAPFTYSFLAALNQEAAGQYEMAVISYQTALNTHNRYSPDNFIKNRLAKIQLEHPEDYSAGINRVASLGPSGMNGQPPR